MSFQQFKRRYFCIKQQADQTYNLEYFKDERKSDVKGVIYLDLAQEIVKVGRLVLKSLNIAWLSLRISLNLSCV